MCSKAEEFTERILKMSTWNISSINKNPLEYWVTYDENPEYRTVMSGVDAFVTRPGVGDVAVQEVFTETMFAQLEQRMNSLGWYDVRSFWESDYRHRRIISEFLMDPKLHANRLAANLTRFTDTIDVVGSNQPVCRPSVLGMYDGDLNNWWSLWKAFMFDEPLTIRRKKEHVSIPPYLMLPPLKKSKYPALTEEEEKHSLPLQVLCGAIFDAILIHIVLKQVSSDIWQKLKREMTETFIRQKLPRTLDLLYQTYGTSDVIFLQEVSRTFIERAASVPLGRQYWICEPFDFNDVQDQNSVVLLRKSTFPNWKPMLGDDLTKLMYESFPEGGITIPIGYGGIVVTTAEDKEGTQYVFSSFHGSSDGSQTVPFLNALDTVVRSLGYQTKEDEEKNEKKKLLVVGIDANTTTNGLSIHQFTKACADVGLASCWGDSPQESNYTTYNARTYLQAQVHKACTRSEVESRGNTHLKDFVLFGKNDFVVQDTKKDNTGEMKYINDMTYPTISFPSDHAVVSTVLSKLHI